MLSSEGSVGIVAAGGSRGFAFDPKPADGVTPLLEYTDDMGGVGAVFGDGRLAVDVTFADEFVIEPAVCVGGCGGGTDGTDGDEIIDALSPLKNNSRFAWICAESKGYSCKSAYVTNA